MALPLPSGIGSRHESKTSCLEVCDINPHRLRSVPPTLFACSCLILAPHTQRHCLRLSWPSRSATRRVKCRGSGPPLCKKLASRRTLCAELAAGAGPCLRQPLNRREAWNKHVASAAPLEGHHGSDTVVRACELAHHPLILRSRLATDLPSLSLFSQR